MGKAGKLAKKRQREQAVATLTNNEITDDIDDENSGENDNELKDSDITTTVQTLWKLAHHNIKDKRFKALRTVLYDQFLSPGASLQVGGSSSSTS